MTQPVDPAMFYRNYVKPYYAPLAAATYLANPGFRGRSRGRSYVARSGSFSRRGVARKSFKSQVMSTLPAKHNSGQLTVNPTHNTIYSANMTGLITQGTGNTNRVADAVRLCAIKLRGFFQTPVAATGMYTYRVMVLWSGEEYTNGTLTAQLTDTEIFLPGTGTGGWGINAIVNPKAVTVLYDETFDVPTLVTTTADLTSYTKTVSINQDFDYQDSASKLGKTKNLYVVVISSVVGGAGGVTSTGVTYHGYDLIFK